MSLVAESQSAHHTLTTRSFVSKHSKAQRNSSRQLDAVIKQSSAQQNRTADQFDRLIAQQGKLVDALGEKPSGAVFSETVSARCYVQVLTSCPQVQMSSQYIANATPDQFLRQDWVSHTGIICDLKVIIRI